MTWAAEVPVPSWLGELAFGAIVVLAVFGYVWFKPAVNSLMERVEKAETQRDALIETYQDEIIPALRDANAGSVRAVETVERSRVTLEATTAVLTEVRALLQRGP